MAVTYKCPNCGASLVYDASRGSLLCDHCGTVVDVDTMEQEFDSEKHIHQDKADQKTQGQGQYTQDQDQLSMKQYHCDSCGAEVLTDEFTAATFCAFCGNPNLIEDRLIDEAKPDLLIPFKISKQQAVEKFRKWTKNGLLTPGEFTNQSTIDKITGMYVPYWLYDMMAHVRLSAHCTNVSVIRHGDTEVTTTRHYQVERDLTAEYSKVPADASKQMEDGMMDKLEPFFYQDITSFEMPYLAGFMAEKYNYSSDQLADRAGSRIRTYAASLAKDTIRGYASVAVTNEKVDLREEGAQYAMLPVWLLNYRYKDRTYTFALNGQTGKMVGDLPVSRKKMILWCFILTLIVFSVWTLIRGLML